MVTGFGGIKMANSLGRKKQGKYKAGLVQSPYSKKAKLMWQLETNIDMLSPDIYEFDVVDAPTKQKAVDILNARWGEKYKGRLRKKPFGWGEGWW